MTRDNFTLDLNKGGQGLRGKIKAKLGPEGTMAAFIRKAIRRELSRKGTR